MSNPNPQAAEQPRRRPWRAAIIVAVVAGVAAIAFTVWRSLPERHSFYSDADQIKTPANSIEPRDILWQPPTRVADLINTAADEYEPRLSWDGLSLYFVRGKAGHNADIFVAQRKPSGWDEPAPLDIVNGNYDDLGPEPSPDGRSLYFYSDRPGGEGGYDLWVSRRGEKGWLPAVTLGPNVNSEFNEYGPAIDPAGATLYFSSNRPADTDIAKPDPNAWPATLREDHFQRPYDLYSAILADSGPAPAAPLALLNTPANDGSPAVSPSGDFLYFSSDRPGGKGGFDLYRTRIRRGLLQPPSPLDQLNTADNELDSALGMGGFALYFSSNRLSANDADVTRREYNLYQSFSREVFRDVETAQRPAINWTGLLRAIMPNLLWALLGLLAMLLLLALLRGFKDKRLSLLVRCLIFSLLLHSLLLFLMSFWQVTTAIANSLRDGGIRVSLAASASADDIASQVRGEVATIAPPPSVEVQTERSAESPPVEARITPVALEVPQTDLPTNLDPTRVTHAADAQPAHATPPQLHNPDVDTPLASNLPELKLPRSTEPAHEPQTEPPPQPQAVALDATPRPVVDIPTSQPSPADSRVALDPVDTKHADPATHATPMRVTAVRDVAAPTEMPLAAMAPDARSLPTNEKSDAPALAIRLPNSPTPDTLPLESNGHASHRNSAAPAPLAADSDSPPPSLPASALNPSITQTQAQPAFFDPVQHPGASTNSSAAPRDAATVARDAAASRDALVLVADISPNPAATPKLDLGLRLPTEISPPENKYAQREPESRAGMVERLGGSKHTEDAVASALDWLARHQHPDGHWDGGQFDAGCNQCGGQTDKRVNVALTGLSLLCFLGAGHTHTKPGPYTDNVRRGLLWLTSRQMSDGDLRAGEETMYSHGIAAIALCEALGMSEDSVLIDRARAAMHFIVSARDRRNGGWRYEPGQAGDTSVLGWQIMALRSAAAAGLDVPYEGFDSARSWLRLVESSERPGLFAYRPGRPVTPTMTAEALLTRQILGESRGNDPRTASAISYILRHPPDWKNEPNTYYWYYATMALFQHQGPAWSQWNEALVPQLLQHQHKTGKIAGSWDPVGEWAEVGGRVYQTAMCALILEVYYRYLPNFASERAGGARTISGLISDARTDAPLPGAQVRLDLPESATISVSAGPDGRYALDVPDVPAFFALSASHPGYDPAAINIAAASLRGSGVTRDFKLRPTSPDVVVLEDTPEVHHLGNNLFEGSINSQFQKEAEGEAYSTTFTIHPDQLAGRDGVARLALMAKGVQCPHEVHINGRRLRDSLSGTPNDGSFGELSLRVQLPRLQSGENTLEIRAVSCTGDLDDFEFVNLQIHLPSRSEDSTH